MKNRGMKNFLDTD